MKKPFAIIKPVEFYGNGVPKPRFFDNPQFNSVRVDPLLSWSKDAHWSMTIGGPIEGKLDQTPSTIAEKSSGSESPPEAPMVYYYRQRRFFHSDEEIGLDVRRNLNDDFDRVAGELKTNTIASLIERRTSPRLAKKFRLS